MYQLVRMQFILISFLRALVLAYPDKRLHGMVSSSFFVAATGLHAIQKPGEQLSQNRELQSWCSVTATQALDPHLRQWHHSTDFCGNKTPYYCIRIGIGTLELFVISGIGSVARINQPFSMTSLVLLQLLRLLNVRTDKTVWIKLEFHA